VRHEKKVDPPFGLGIWFFRSSSDWQLFNSGSRTAMGVADIDHRLVYLRYVVSLIVRSFLGCFG
jgi:hypothetical protein